MANNSHFAASRVCSKSQQVMTSKDSTEKCMEDSGLSIHEHSRTDSGFCSGANLLSDPNISSEELSTPISQKSGFDLDPTDMRYRSSYSRLDSGVDVSLNDQFSSLSLHKNNFNDLDSEIGSCSSSGFVPNVCDSEEHKTPKCEPWEIYYQQDEDGDTQLHIAIIQGFIEVVFKLIQMAPHPCFLDIRNSVVQSPLHIAILTHQPRVARRLVVSGADPAQRDRNGNTALHLACQNGDLECVLALTEAITVGETDAAAVRHPHLTRQLPQDLDEMNYEGETCVHLAAKEGHIDILRRLAWYGANINARDGKGGRTVLHYAVESCDQTLLNFLLEEKSAGLIVDTPTYAGRSAYQIAAALKSSAASALLARGAAVMDLDDDDDDHPDHNAEDSEDEMEELSVVRSGIESYAQQTLSAR